jgi:hypothetical protein
LKVDLVDIPFSDIDTEIYNFRNYFRFGIFAKSKIKDTASPEDYRYFHETIVSVPKLVWLTKEYVNGGGFRFPVTATWSKEKNKWFIHPGYFRKAIIEWFSDKDTMECFCSEEHSYKVKKTFSSAQEIKDFYNVDVTIKGNEIHSLSDYEISRLTDWHKVCKKFFSTTKIIANFDLGKFGYDEEKILTNPKKVLKVNAHSEIEQYRAMLLMPVFDKFDNYGVKIECS